MMNPIKVDVQAAESFVPPSAWKEAHTQALEALYTLKEGRGAGNDFLGWLSLPKTITKLEITQIKEAADDLSRAVDVVVVIGIGGSYLGAKAVIEALSHSFQALLPQRERPLVLFAGQNLSEDYVSELLELMQGRSCSCVVISKSGTTMEPALAFRVIKKHIEEKYGKTEAVRRIAVVTDASQGILKRLSDGEGYRSFVIPNDVGGRFSVLTPVGLLPMAVAGVDIEALVAGACAQMTYCLEACLDNPALRYAAARNALHRQGKLVELLANYHPKLHYLTEWWKQLFGESEGKEGRGIFPAGVDFTTDLHSLGQYIQQGPRFLMETLISIAQAERNLHIEADTLDLDGLNYLSGKRIDECNKMAELGTLMAHVAGGVPNIRIEIPKLDAYHLGALLYFFEVACGISAYMLGVNPFDQAGVEAYKKNMLNLLGKC